MPINPTHVLHGDMDSDQGFLVIDGRAASFELQSMLPFNPLPDPASCCTMEAP